MSEWKGKIKCIANSQPKDINTACELVLRYYNATKEIAVTELASLTIGNTTFLGSEVLHKPTLLSEISSKFLGNEAVVSVAVVCTKDGVNTKTFNGFLTGTIVSPAGVKQFEFDQIFKPLNCNLTLSELSSQKFVLPLRTEPYLSLAAYLRPYEYSGVFETHVTVKLCASSDVDYSRQIDNFRTFCQLNHVKPLLIELENLNTSSGNNSRLEYPTQMMTSSYISGNFSHKAHKEAFRIGLELAYQGYQIMRVKVEAMLSNEGVPETDDLASKLPLGNYFEFHVKIPLGVTHQSHGREIHDHSNCSLDCIWKLCSEYNAHLSRNSFKVHSSTQIQERFATLRMYNKGKEEALFHFNAFVKALGESGYEVLSKQREYSIYDSNVGLDSGWINSPHKEAPATST